LRELEEIKAQQRAQQEAAEALSAPQARPRMRFGRLIGSSPVMCKLYEQIERAGRTWDPVLILGESGTGKELVAKEIHARGSFPGEPFLSENCAAVAETLLESELFGHRKGSFTGATQDRDGLFIQAGRGTLFLDEVGDMPSNMQAKLLRVLQESELERVGGGGLIKVDVRVVAATNKDLTKAIEEGEFRADLYDRLNVVPLRVPPLRERKEDIPLLASAFLRTACEVNDRRGKSLTDGALKQLSAYDYPGNVRELKNMVERLVILTPDDIVNETDARALLPIGGGGRTAGGYYEPGRPLKEMLEDAERDLVLRSLEHNKGHITNTAADLGLERSHLYKKMKALGIKRGE
jgi:transcriptional regulator with GAF, ATPase, and Fis domain